MNIIEGIQKSVEYIESNLLDKDLLDIKNIAEISCYSECYFRKIFSILTGITVADYIRNRRLSLAGEELLTSDTKIIDLAYKYGYDTPESFTKAFTRFHGNTPSFVKTNNSGLTSFNPIQLKIDVEGGSMLEYKIESEEAFSIIGKSGFFNSDSIEENNEIIPALSKEYFNSDEFIRAYNDSKCQGKTIKVYGFRDEDTKDGDKLIFRYTIGILNDKSKENDNMDIVEIPAMKWVKFKCTGKMPQAMQNLWYRVYSEFIPFSSIKLNESITLEVSELNTEHETSYLWIPIRQM